MNYSLNKIIEKINQLDSIYQMYLIKGMNISMEGDIEENLKEAFTKLNRKQRKDLMKIIDKYIRRDKNE